jgi:cysteinyl-tRNA synthetase
MIAGARVEVAPYKKNPHDFVLWKPSKADEPSWPSPWGHGRPGWHIECSAMIEQTLGLPIDIHGGGIDLVFPHHENEIAQGVCAHGHANDASSHDAYSRYWMHNGFLTVDAEKMSKSVGNVLLLHDLVQSIPGEVVRWALLSAHYRQPLDWNQSLLDQSRKNLDRLYGALRRCETIDPLGDMPSPEFLTAISDDLNTPGAMATLFALSSEIERAMTAGDHHAVAIAKAELLASGRILGVLLSSPDVWFEGGADDALKSQKPDVRRFVGNEGGFGGRIGLSETWAINAVRAVGNYGEIFERNIGSRSKLGIPRGINHLWSLGGIQYAPPMR